MDEARFDALVEEFSDWRTNPPLLYSAAEMAAS